MNKQKLREIIFGYRTKAGKRFDVILLVAILISVIAVMLDSDKEIHKHYGRLLLIAEWFFTLLFTVEYILRLYCSTDKKKYTLSFMGIIDLLSIIPTYLIIFYAPIGYLIDIRVLRLIRIFRIFKLSPYLRSGHTMQIALRSSRPKIIVFILSVSLVVIILGTLMYIIEGQQNGFDNIPKSIYWAVVTLTTVGYGDVVPLTTLGKTVAVFIMLLGYAIIAVPTGIVSSELTKYNKEKKQERNQSEIIEKEKEILSKEEEILKKLDSLEKKIDQLK
ncbi:MAG: pH-gated potassium channel KcsA [Cryomorphaceae bacterium]|nr:MAG: pH-gated potassium channel KcsA [Cryomorphaceae bacterium]